MSLLDSAHSRDSSRRRWASRRPNTGCYCTAPYATNCQPRLRPPHARTPPNHRTIRPQSSRDMPARRGKLRYYVYVVALDDTVWNEARFRRANPEYRFERPCVYVGMTGLDPDLRFDRHKAGIQSNRYVRDYGLRLLPELYEVFNPMPYD